MGNKKQIKKTKGGAKEAVLPQDNWVVWLVYAILILVPVILSRISFDQFDIVKMAVFKVLVLSIAGVWLAGMLSKTRPIVWSWREALLIGFLVLGVLSVITSIHIPTALHGKYKRYEGLLTFISYFTVYLIALQVFRKKNQVRTFMEIVSFTGAFVAFYGILQFAGLDPMYWGEALPFEQRRSFSTFGNPDLLAGYLVIALPCALVAFFDDTKRRWLHGGSVFILAVGLMTALTRSGWIGAVVATLCVAALIGRRLKNYKPELAVMGAVLAVALVGLTIYSASHPELSIASKFKGAFNLSSGSTAKGRFEIWKAGWHMVKDRPLFGQGLDTFRLASEHYETKDYVKSVAGGTVADNAHNYFIHLAAGGGPAAAVLLYVFFLAWFVRMVRIRSRAPDDASRLYIAGGAAAVLGYLATMVFGISIVGASSTFWLLMGALSGYTSRWAPEYRVFDVSRWSPRVKLAAALPVIGVSAAIALVSVTMYVSDIYFVRGLKAQAIGIEVIDAYMDKAAALYPGNGRIPSQLGQVYFNWAGAAQSEEDAKRFTDKSIESFERAKEAEPLEVDYMIFLANVYGRTGQIEEANELLAEATARRPYSVPGHFLAGEIAAVTGRTDGAIDHYELVYELAPNYMATPDKPGPVPGLLAKLYAASGNTAKAAAYQRIVDETSVTAGN